MSPPPPPPPPWPRVLKIKNDRTWPAVSSGNRPDRERAMGEKGPTKRGQKGGSRGAAVHTVAVPRRTASRRCGNVLIKSGELI